MKKCRYEFAVLIKCLDSTSVTHYPLLLGLSGGLCNQDTSKTMARNVEAFTEKALSYFFDEVVRFPL